MLLNLKHYVNEISSIACHDIICTPFIRPEDDS